MKVGVKENAYDSEQKLKEFREKNTQTLLDDKLSMLTSDQKMLKEELLKILDKLETDGDSCVQNLKKFLDSNKSNEDLKFILARTQCENEKAFLHYATKHNCLQAIELLLKAGADPNVQDKGGKTPLHYFADNQSDYDDIIRAFLEKGAKVDIQDESGNTPLHYAVRCGHINAIELLIEHSINNKQNVNLQNKSGDTALHLAIYCAEDERIIDPFFRDKLNLDFSIKNSEGITPFLAAVKNANLNIVKFLLAKPEIKIDYKDIIHGGSILHHVMANQNISHISHNTHSNTQQPDFECENKHDVTNRIINAVVRHIKEDEIKFVIDCVDVGGNPPLFVAVERGNCTAVELLIGKGANVNIVNEKGYKVFHYAVKIKSLKMLKILLPKKEKKDENGVTVIEENGLPVEEIDAEKAKELLSVIDEEGNTLLHHAVSKGCSEEMIDFFVEYGVDVDKKNNSGVAPIHIAAKYGHPDLISCLIKNKANCSTKCGNLTKSHIDSIGTEFPVVMNYINVQGSDINNSTVNTENDNAYREATPILIADDSDDTDVVNILASWGAKQDIQDDEGWDTLLIAIKRACSKDLKEEEKQKMCEVIKNLASTANDGILKYLADMKRRALEEQLRDRIKSLATSRLNDNNEILNVSVLPQVTGGKLGNLIQMSIEAKRLGQEKRYISKLFSKDKLLGSIICKETQMYKERVFNKLKNIIENTLTLSNDDEVHKIIESAFCDTLSTIKSRSSTSALVGRNTDFDDNFYEKIGSGVKEIPELHYDTCANIEKENTESSVNQKKELPPEMDRGLKKFRDNINEFWKNAEDAIREGKLESLEVDNTTFFLECLEDSIVEIAKITDGARDLGLTQGDMAFGSNIVKIGKNKVEITTQKGIRNYTDLTDNSDIALTFSTSLGELKVNLYPDKQDKDKIIVEVSDKKEILEKFKNCKEEIGKNCLLGGRLVYDAIKQGYFERSGKLCQSLETISLSKELLEGVKAAVKDLNCGDIVSSPSSNVFLSKAIMQEGKTRA